MPERWPAALLEGRRESPDAAFFDSRGNWQRWRLSLPWLGAVWLEECRFDEYYHKEDTRISLAFNRKVTAIALALAPHNLRAVALIFLSRFS
jgi:hypothetical protein